MIIHEVYGLEMPLTSFKLNYNKLERLVLVEIKYYIT